MRRWAIAAALVAPHLTAALLAPHLAAAEPRKLLVLQSEGRADASLRAKIDAAITRLAAAAEPGTSPGELTFSDAATAVGCRPDAPSCKDDVIGMLSVDENRDHPGHAETRRAGDRGAAGRQGRRRAPRDDAAADRLAGRPARRHRAAVRRQARRPRRRVLRRCGRWVVARCRRRVVRATCRRRVVRRCRHRYNDAVDHAARRAARRAGAGDPAAQRHRASAARYFRSRRPSPPRRSMHRARAIASSRSAG